MRFSWWIVPISIVVALVALVALQGGSQSTSFAGEVPTPTPTVTNTPVLPTSTPVPPTATQVLATPAATPTATVAAAVLPATGATGGDSGSGSGAMLWTVLAVVGVAGALAAGAVAFRQRAQSVG